MVYSISFVRTEQILSRPCYQVSECTFFLEQLHINQQRTAEIEWFFYVVDNNLLFFLRRRWILTFVVFSWLL